MIKSTFSNLIAPDNDDDTIPPVQCTRCDNSIQPGKGEKFFVDLATNTTICMICHYTSGMQISSNLELFILIELSKSDNEEENNQKDVNQENNQEDDNQENNIENNNQENNKEDNKGNNQENNNQENNNQENNNQESNQREKKFFIKISVAGSRAPKTKEYPLSTTLSKIKSDHMNEVLIYANMIF
jgi:hypothetical protein